MSHNKEQKPAYSGTLLFKEDVANDHKQRQVKNNCAVIQLCHKPPTPYDLLQYLFLTIFSSFNIYCHLPLYVVSLSKVSVIPSQQRSENSHWEIPEVNDS